MRLLFAFLLSVFAQTVYSQVKSDGIKVRSEGIIGLHITPFFKGNEVGFGGQAGFLVPIGLGGKIGGMLAPTYMKEAGKVMVLAYGDLRISITELVDLTLQPGYNLYNNKYTNSTSTYSMNAQVKGSFTGAGELPVMEQQGWQKGPDHFFN